MRKYKRTYSPPPLVLAVMILNGVIACRPAVDDNGTGGDIDLVDNSVTTTKIKDAAVTPAKLSQAYLPLGGGTLSGALILSSDPSVAMHAATKQYADGKIAGLTVDSSALTSIANNQVLGWNSTTQKWAPITVVGAADATQIQGVNVDSVAPTSNQFFYYNSTSSKWTPGVALTTNGQLLVGKTGDVPQVVTMSGDATISNTGAVTIANSAISAAKVNDGVLTDVKMSGISSNCSSGQILKANGSGGFYCGSPQAMRVNQTAHGLSIGNAIYNNSGSFAVALSTHVSTGGIFIVNAVIDANNFEMVQAGKVSGLAGLVAGTAYYVSASVAGSLTTTRPTSGYNSPVLIADTTTSGYVVPYGGRTYASGEIVKTAYSQTSANTDLSNAPIPGVNTAPAVSEGAEIFSLAFTPTLSTSKIRIEWCAYGAEDSNHSNSFSSFIFLVGDTNARALAVGKGVDNGDSRSSGEAHGLYEFTPGSASAFTVKVRAGTDGNGSVTLNKLPISTTHYTWGNTIYSWVKIEEIAP